MKIQNRLRRHDMEIDPGPDMDTNRAKKKSVSL